MQCAVACRSTHGVRHGRGSAHREPCCRRCSIFIGDVVDEWQRRELGVGIADRRVGGLLLADDSVLLADSADYLREQWRELRTARDQSTMASLAGRRAQHSTDRRRADCRAR